MRRAIRIHALGLGRSAHQVLAGERAASFQAGSDAVAAETDRLFFPR